MRKPLAIASLRLAGALALVAALVTGLAAVVVAEPSGKDGLETPKFEFALIGDLQYGPEGEAQWPALRADIEAANLAFVVHNGDFKNARSLCSDELFQSRYADFRSFEHPFVYLPGDNDWTDCHAADAGGFDPVERLNRLRELFYPDEFSLGQRTIRLTRQSDTVALDLPWRIFREHQRWVYGNVVFVGLNVQGSNNNRGRTPEQDAEYTVRNAAGNAFLRESFALARDLGSPAMMVVIQANPGFEARNAPGSGFTEFLDVLDEETLRFAQRPVVLVHGDSHYFRIDKPLVARTSRRRVEHFTRVETFGNPNNHWLRAFVDPRDPNVFSFRQEIVEANVIDHTP